MSVSMEQFDCYRKKFMDLVRAEIDLDMKRIREADAYLMPINDFVVYFKNNTVNINNFKWKTYLKYKSARVWMDLSQQLFEFHYNIEDLYCTAEYCSLHFAPGACCFSMPDIEMVARVGIWSLDDRFRPYSYDFDFNLEALATDLKLQCHEAGGAELSQRTVIEITKAILRNITFEHIFESAPEIINYRTYEMGRRQMANNMFDTLLQNYIQKALTKVTIPLHGVFELNKVLYTIKAESKFKDFKSLKRVGDATWFAYQHHRVFAMVKFGVCQFDFTDCLITGLYDESLQIKGNFVMSPYYNSMFLRFAVAPRDPNQVNITLEVLDLEFQYGLPESGSKLTPILGEVLPFMQGHVRYMMFNLFDQIHIDYPIIPDFFQ